MRKDNKAVRMPSVIDPSWRAIIEQRVVADRMWRHVRRDLALADVSRREPRWAGVAVFAKMPKHS